MGINRPLFFLYLRLFDTVDCSKYTFANDCSQTADLCGQSCKAVYDRNLRLYSRTIKLSLLWIAKLVNELCVSIVNIFLSVLAKKVISIR